jgi:serine/threonine-protein kinase
MPWTTGQRLQGGKYVIDKVLGQGGFGITYKALHVELNRTVVIKTPNEYLSHDPEYDKYIDRFIQEGRTLARLSQDPHPHIVGVIDLFKEGTIHCLVMDFVPGENLFEAVKRRGALPEAEIVPCICQIGEALVVVHQVGLVHRDAHPGNIMLRTNGKAVLIDFGIAKELVPKTLSSKGIAGNEGFAPYEQMSRGSREPTVDVYCLAATLYYGVTGQRPTTSLARKLDNTSLTPPRQINLSISDRLNQAILKGMALEAKDRPQSMQVWLAMLEAPKAIPDKSSRIIPWGLVGVLLSYLLIGYFLAASNAPYIVWIAAVGGGGAWAWAVGRGGAWAVNRGGGGGGAWAWAVTGFGTGAWAVNRGGGGAKAWAVAVALTGSWTGAWTGAWTGTWAGAVAGSVAVAVTVAVTVAMALALAWIVVGIGEELRKSFSKVNIFLILTSTSSLGLGLGWLGHRIFNTGT